MSILRKDNKKCVRYLFSVFFALLVFCFTSLILTQENNALAVSDISITYTANQSVSDWSDLFPNCSGSCLAQYKYLIVSGISLLNTTTSPMYINLYTRWNDSNIYGLTLSANSSFSIYELPFTLASSYNLLQFHGGFTFYNDVTFTLTESYQSGSPSGSITLTQNGTYDVTSYAEAVVDVPPEVLPGDYDDEFSNVVTAIYICGASVIMLYFFYIIYGIIIKPTGGYK